MKNKTQAASGNKKQVKVLKKETRSGLKDSDAAGKLTTKPRNSKNEEKYRNILKNIQEGYFEVDLAGNFTFLNNSACRILGYSREKLMGMNYRRYTDEENAKIVFQVYNKVYKTEKPAKAFGWQITRKDGAKRYIEGSISLLKDSSGKSTGFSGSINDITEKRKAEKNYQTLFREMLDGFALHEIICDTQGQAADYRFLTVNPAFERMTGLKAENIVGRTVLEILPGTEQHWIDAYGRVALTGEPALFEDYSKNLDKYFQVTAFRSSPNRFACIFADITERKRTEEALQAWMRRYNLIVESSGQIAYEYIVPTGDITWGNSIEKVLGYSIEEISGGFTQWQELLHPDDRQNTLDLLKVAEKAMTYWDAQYRIQHKNGHYVWIRDRGFFLPDADGRVYSQLGMLEDITERKQTQEVLRENEEKFRTIFEHAPLSISITNSEGRYVDVNARMCESAKLSREEIIGHMFDELPNVAHFENPEDATKLTQKLQKQGWLHNEEIQMIRPINKERSSVLLSSRQITLAGKPTVLSMVLDITERKRAEERYQSIFKNAQEGIYQSTPEGKFIIANQSMARILGYDSPEDLISSVTDIAHQLYVDQEERTKFIKMTEQGVTSNDEVQFYRTDGRIIWVSRTMQAVRNERGQILYYEGIAEDITGRKESVERLGNALRGTVRAIASMVETRDPYTAGHQRNVADLARAIAREMGLSNDRIEGLHVAGTIHDIGKISVPAEILSKPNKLTDIEFRLIKTHAQAGYNILKDIEFPWPIARMVIEHHERMDGSGYPNGITGNNLLLESRILSVADVVEAMASHRPYRAALGPAKALEEIARNKGTFYDQEVVTACLRLFNEKGYKIKD